MLLARALAALFLLLATAVHGSCVGDCGGDGTVTVSDLILGVSVLLGNAPLSQCSAMDANGDGTVGVDELVAAVNAALGGCPSTMSPTPRRPTSTPSATPPASATPTPTVTSTPAIGPVISFFGIASADDQLMSVSAVQSDGTPVFELAFGFGFRLVVEASRGPSGVAVGAQAFSDGSAPDLQVEATRPLGNGSGAVCDNTLPDIGGVPAIDPPSFAETSAVADVLNDFGCRFENGNGEPIARQCPTSCVRVGNVDYDCVSTPSPEAQFCALISAALEFPPGDTLVTVRVRDQAGNLGAPQRMVVRIQAP